MDVLGKTVLPGLTRQNGSESGTSYLSNTDIRGKNRLRICFHT